MFQVWVFNERVYVGQHAFIANGHEMKVGFQYCAYAKWNWLGYLTRKLGLYKQHAI